MAEKSELTVRDCIGNLSRCVNMDAVVQISILNCDSVNVVSIDEDEDGSVVFNSHEPNSD